MWGYLPRCEAELPLVRLFVDRTQTCLDLPHRSWHRWLLRLDRVLTGRSLVVYGRDLRCRCRASGDLGRAPLLRGFLGGARLLPARNHVASVRYGVRLDANCRDRVQVIEIFRGGVLIIRRRNLAEPETSLRVLRAFPKSAVSALHLHAGCPSAKCLTVPTATDSNIKKRHSSSSGSSGSKSLARWKESDTLSRRKSVSGGSRRTNQGVSSADFANTCIDSQGLAKVDFDQDTALEILRPAAVPADGEVDAFSGRNEPVDLLVSGARFLKDGQELSVRVDFDESPDVGIGEQRAAVG